MTSNLISIPAIAIQLIDLLLIGALVYLACLAIQALRKYIKAAPIRHEKQETARTLGQVLKQHRTNCKMTQEFVAEALGVSRQAVSKWESGASDPNTSNLKALGKLYGVPAEDILKEAR